MGAPDPRRTEDAVRQVRAVWPLASLLQSPSWWLNAPRFHVYKRNEVIGSDIIGAGDTAKDAWWAAVPKALAAALTGEST